MILRIWNSRLRTDRNQRGNERNKTSSLLQARKVLILFPDLIPSMKRTQKINQVGTDENLARNESESNHQRVKDETSTTVIKIQPQVNEKMKKMMEMPIINAHEFAPHPSINILTAFDILIVKENSEFYSKLTGDMKRNKYQVVTNNGSLVYNVIEGRCF